MSMTGNTLFGLLLLYQLLKSKTVRSRRCKQFVASLPHTFSYCNTFKEPHVLRVLKIQRNDITVLLRLVLRYLTGTFF